MTIEIKMPRLSETMQDGKILSWNKKEGDYINKGDILAEVETDKANMEVESIDSGALSYILVPAGQSAKVGETIAILNAPPEKEIKENNEKEKQEEQEVKSTQAENSEGEIEISQSEQSTLPQKELEEKKEIKPEEVKEENTENVEKLKIKASPLARKLAKEKNINIFNVKGTGPGGRIQEKDIINYEATSGNQEVETQPPEQGSIHPLSKIRQTIAARMAQSKQTIPHFYITVDVNADSLINFPQKYKENHNVHVTFNDIFIKVTAMSLEKYQVFNSEFKNDSIEIKQDINIGIAFALKDGLLVPVIHSCNQKSLTEVADKSKEIKYKIKNNKLKPEDLSGGTFTVSNMGMYGVKQFSPIINPPEAATLAIGSIYKTPVFRNNKVDISNIVNLTLSADHRIVDGAQAAFFLNAIKETIENIDSFSEI